MKKAEVIKEIKEILKSELRDLKDPKEIEKEEQKFQKVLQTIEKGYEYLEYLKKNPEEIRRKEIASNAKVILDPQNWLEKAENLVFSAKILKPKVLESWDFWCSPSPKEPRDNNSPPPDPINMTCTFLMLLGYAIENYVKAVLVSRLTQCEKRIVERTGKLPQEVKGHCSVEFVRRLGIKFSCEEIHLIERIRRAVLWRGRYPSPLGAEGKLFPPNVIEGPIDAVPMDDVKFAIQITNRIKEVAEKPYTAG